ncbi:alcohol dehydrogenase class IV [Sphingobium subterraneum]|uniref:Alcohol dehydrogenase class IV n=1 Tax=Sphingobium subterraneum TaxID=627688 RepID=A0A841J3J3_9SPHN|nr:alcohol dehydrogenase class IV [Sphingobium subterraneum]
MVVIAAGRRADQPGEIERLLGPIWVGTFDEAQMHTPVAVTDKALHFLRARGADGLVTIGGGSAIGLSKALALRTDLPQIVLPTTYAGSEVTPVVGETRDGQKQIFSDPRILPESVIYDVDLTLAVRPGAAVLSGLNAIAHAVEALYARDRNPLVSSIAIAGIELLASALPVIARDGSDIPARARALQGAWLCGTCLALVGMSLHHKLCHTLGGMFDLPHAALHAAVLPHAAAFNESAVREHLKPVARIFGAADAATGLYRFACELGVEMALGAIGMPESGVATAVEATLENPYWNPRALTAEGLRALLEDAFAGRPPYIQTRRE